DCYSCRLGLAPAAEDEAAEGEADAEHAHGEGADRGCLAGSGERIPAAECLFLLHRERLAAALLAQGAARSQPEIEVVEDLGRLVRHRHECTQTFGSANPAPPYLGPPRRHARSARGRA